MSFVKTQVFCYSAPEDRGKNEKVTDIRDLPICPLVFLCEFPESCDLFLKQVLILQSLIPKIPNKSKFLKETPLVPLLFFIPLFLFHLHPQQRQFLHHSLFLLLLSQRLLRLQSVQKIDQHFQISSNTTNPSSPPPCTSRNFSKPSQRFQHRSLAASSPPVPPFATLPTPSHLLQQHSLLSSSASFRDSSNTTLDNSAHLFQLRSSMCLCQKQKHHLRKRTFCLHKRTLYLCTIHDLLFSRQDTASSYSTCLHPYAHL